MKLKLKAARKAANLTQAQLADKLGVTETTVGYWEQGRSEPTLAGLRRLAKVLGVPCGELLDDSRTNA